jgi:hypothetical protein
MRHHPLAILLIVIALGACSKTDKDQAPFGLHQLQPADAPAPAPSEAKVVAGGVAGDVRTKYLAYEHVVQIGVTETGVAAAYAAAQAACTAAAAEQCVVLRAALNSGSPASASLQMRARPAGIRKLVALLGEHGEILSQSMNAEDLAGPIEETGKKLAMLKDYRERLEDLRGRAANTIDTLIRVNQELAQVQSQVEAQSGEGARLTRRVDTELLNIEIRPKEERSLWQPVALAASGFIGNLAAGASAAINTVAYALPFGAALLALAWLLRRLWPRWRKPA